jgi:hypothetical protein
MIGFASIEPFGLEMTLKELSKETYYKYSCLGVELPNRLWVQLPLPLLFKYIHKNIITQTMSRL